MSIGASKNFSSTASGAVVVDYSAFITPSSATRSNLPLGAATSVLINGNVTGGVGPFTYLWSRVSGASFTINSPTNINTTFSTFAVKAAQTQTGVYKFTVTDTGNGNAEESANITITFEFAAPPF